MYCVGFPATGWPKQQRSSCSEEEVDTALVLDRVSEHESGRKGRVVPEATRVASPSLPESAFFFNGRKLADRFRTFQ